jgi:hypothetical protein
MPKLADYGLTIETDAKRRWLKRGDVAVPITALQRDMLEWFDGAVTPSLEYCCDELWEQVDVEWVRGLWDKLATLMVPLGVAVLMDDSDMLFIGFVDAEGSPTQPVLETKAVEEPAAPATPSQIEIERDRAWAEVAALELQIEQYREAAQGQMIIVNQAKDALAERDQARAKFDALRLQRDQWEARYNEAMDRLHTAQEHVLRLQSAQPSAEVIPLRDGPVRIAPRYLTVPVSEALFRWLESAGDRNRRSADDMARALLVAFMRSTGNREAA